LNRLNDQAGFFTLAPQPAWGLLYAHTASGLGQHSRPNLNDLLHAIRVQSLLMDRENIDALKDHPTLHADLRYRLRHANVYVSRAGYHFTDYLDPVEEISPEIDPTQLTDQASSYIETQLQANSQRFEHQVQVIKKFLPLAGARVLDIGCGGGLFLSLLEREGAQTVGIELNDSRAQYAATKHDLQIHKIPIERDFWQREYREHFDAVTLWDVIEHVNFPFQTLRSAANVLKRGGLLLVDTPCRDSFYHRAGELTYRLSRGRYPTFLNAMYSSHLFGHKQIFSTREMTGLFEAGGLETVELEKFHELSFPYEFYLQKLLHSDVLVDLSLPLVRTFFRLVKIRNKMLVIGKKK
jgi:2-polyprenyl-6-hydroxyphenyl methylase/3-demethylubiquinone-9 3-methyltransferase